MFSTKVGSKVAAMPPARAGLDEDDVGKKRSIGEEESKRGDDDELNQIQYLDDEQIKQFAEATQIQRDNADAVAEAILVGQSNIRTLREMEAKLQASSAKLEHALQNQQQFLHKLEESHPRESSGRSGSDILEHTTLKEREKATELRVAVETQHANIQSLREVLQSEQETLRNLESYFHDQMGLSAEQFNAKSTWNVPSSQEVVTNKFSEMNVSPPDPNSWRKIGETIETYSQDEEPQYTSTGERILSTKTSQYEYIQEVPVSSTTTTSLYTQVIGSAEPSASANESASSSLSSTSSIALEHPPPNAQIGSSIPASRATTTTQPNVANAARQEETSEERSQRSESDEYRHQEGSLKGKMREKWEQFKESVKMM